MPRRLCRSLALGAVLALALPAWSAAAPAVKVATYHARATFPASLSNNLPLLRLHFTQATKAKKLPTLTIRPALSTRWQQIGPRDVQLVATEALAPSTSYTVRAPTSVTCAKACVFTAFTTQVAGVAANVTWEAQLLAESHYLPLTFTPGTPQQIPSQEVNGTYTWTYPNLPASLSSQWRLGTDNVILHAAMMTFQSQHSLPVTGEIDATTWGDLVSAVNAHQVDPASYNYVDVSMALPETLTLYVAGKVIFHTLVNTGVPAAPTETGTFPVYTRYLTTTMTGTNPDGTHYSDPGIPWVSYFNGGDALHGFIRSSYGFPQSVGCVEMPFASAETVYPYTPIGTLVTVHA